MMDGHGGGHGGRQSRPPRFSGRFGVKTRNSYVSFIFQRFCVHVVFSNRFSAFFLKNLFMLFFSLTLPRFFSQTCSCYFSDIVSSFFFPQTCSCYFSHTLPYDFCRKLVYVIFSRHCRNNIAKAIVDRDSPLDFRLHCGKKDFSPLGSSVLF